MITYSSYRRHRANQTTPGLVVGFANSSFELLAGIGVFSIIGFMAHQEGVAIEDLEGLKGVGLAFMTFPKVVSEMPGSTVCGAIFFGALLAAGFTSLLSILQVIVASVQDKFGLTERRSAVAVGAPLAVVSTVLFATTTGLNVLDVMDYWVNNLGIVVSAIVLTVSAIWVSRRGRELAYHLSSLSTFKVGTTWLFLAGVFSPVMLLVMLVQVVVGLITSGYDPDSYSRAFEFQAGWLMVIVLILGAVAMTAVPWRKDPDDFEPWPVYQGKEG
jgi:NSS family neurotransmitter:Na+ symporter